MEKITKNLRWLLASLMLVVGMSSAWADDYTYDFSSGGTNSSTSNTWTTNYFTIVQEKGTSTTNVADYLTPPRWYKSHIVTFTPVSGYTISKIVINCSAANYNGQTITASSGNVSASGNNSTWTGSIDSSSPLVLTMGKQCRPTSVVVTYTAAATNQVATPSFDPNGGTTFLNSQDVTINCATDGATIQYSTDGTSWLNYEGAITLTATTTLYAKATKTGMDDSSVANATFTKATVMTVADAITYIGTLGTATSPDDVYVQGIVSQIDSYNSNYHSITYWISDDGGTTTQMEVYSGKGLNGADFSAATDLTVGDQVVVCGKVKMYSGTPEFTQSSTIVQLTQTTLSDPELAYNPTTVDLNVGDTFTAPTLSNPHNLALTYESSNTAVATVAADGTVTLGSGTGSTTITASFAGDATYHQGSASFTLTVTDPNAPGTENNPYNVADAITYIESLGSSTSPIDVYVSGIISQVDSYSNGAITYWISDDGNTTTQMEVYKGKGLNGDDFTAKEDLAVGDEVTVCGKVKKYNTTPEFDSGSKLTAFNRPAGDTRTETHIVFLKGQGSAEEEQIPSGSNIEMTVGDNVVFTPARMAIYNSLDQEIIKVTTEGEITYTVDKPELGTVNEISGEVTLVAGATGTLKVKAEYAGSSEYKPSTGYYTLKVKPAQVTPTGTGDEITYDFVGVEGTSYTPWTGKTGTSGAVYAGQTAGGNTSVQMRATSPSGIVTTTSGGKVTMVTVEWNDNTSNSRTLDIYGSNTAYSDASDLYDSSTQGTKLGSICIDDGVDQLAITGDYAYIGIRSNSGALWCDKITIYWDTPTSTEVATTTTIDATGLTNTDVYTSTEAGTLTATVMAGTTAVSGATVTWESSNTEVATIDTDGVVTLVAAGSTIITATYAGVTGEYQSSSDTYELTVTNSSATPGDELFNETFAGFDGTGGRDGVYSGSVGAGSTDSGTDETGWSFEKCGAASSSLKFGTGSANGVFTTRSIALNGNGTLTFSAAGWGSGTNTLAVTAEGGDVSGNTDITLENSEWKDYTVNITGATGNLVLTFTGKRGFIDDIKVVSAAPDERTATTVTLTPATESYNVILGEDFTAPTAALDPAAAGTLTYESSDEDVATVASNGAVTIKAAGTTTITAKFEGTTEYKPSQAAYTIVVTAPATVYTSLQQLQENVTSTETAFTMNATDIYVTGVNGNQAWISDGTYGALIYTSGHGLTVGQKLNGTLSGTLVLYHGATEIKNFDSTGLTITAEALPTTTTTIGGISQENQSLPVKFENVTYDASANTFSDGTDAIAFYDQFHVSPTLEDGHQYNISGIIIYHNNLQIAPLAATDVVDVTPAATVEAPVFDPVGGTYDSDQTVTITCATAGAAIYYTLDGTDPTTASTLYTEPVAITTTTTLKAIASDGTNTSTITEATYTINKPTPTTTEAFVLVEDGTITEGDYLIVYDGGAMNTTVEGNRLKFAEVSPDYNNIISTNNASIIWHIAKSGSYYTIYNAAANAYAAGTEVKNNAQMLADGTSDKALWTVEATAGETTFDFTNKANEAKGVNATLRRNGNFGFACYSTLTGDPLSLYKKVSTVSIDLIAAQDNYKTMVAPYDMVVPNISDGIEAYIVTLNSEQTEAYLEPIVNIPAGTPIILHANSAGSYELEKAGTDFTADDVSENVLLVSNGEIEGDGTIFVLNKVNNVVGFYRLNDSMPLATGKCYLKIEKSTDVKFIGFNFDDATGIETVESTNDNLQGTIYNLAGQRVATPAHGLYIVNGKKVLIK